MSSAITKPPIFADSIISFNIGHPIATKPRTTTKYPINNLFKPICLTFLNISINLKASLNVPPLEAIYGIATVNSTSEMNNKIKKIIINIIMTFSDNDGSPKFIWVRTASKITREIIMGIKK